MVSASATVVTTSSTRASLLICHTFGDFLDLVRGQPRNSPASSKLSSLRLWKFLFGQVANTHPCRQRRSFTYEESLLLRKRRKYSSHAYQSIG